ncbi:MAG: DJ-1/PfpI family protein [Prevotella sp.]|nr:DJ-1/PfpI family protein [Candidatus Prevotella equi]
MAKVYEFIANGSEEIEALTVVDVLRRAGIDIKTVSITGTEEVELSHGVKMKCDTTIEAADLSDADMLLLPGGLPGATNLNEHEGVRQAMLRQYQSGKKVGAICAAPLVLGSLGILQGKKATCYPGFEDQMTGAEYTKEIYTIDGNVITGEGPAATLPYSYAILEMLGEKTAAENLREGMMFNHLMSK